MKKVDKYQLTQIFASYNKAPVKVGDTMARIIGIDFERNELILRAMGGVITDAFIEPVDKCKPLLMPLFQIVNVDALAVCEIIYPLVFRGLFQRSWKVERDEEYGVITIRNPRKIYFFQIDTATCDFTIHNEACNDECVNGETSMRPVACVDYLRKKGYDLGHDGIESLIQSNVAISKDVKIKSKRLSKK